MAGHTFHPTLLREYDVRGVVGETLFADNARAIGRAFGTVVRREGGRVVACGYDGRLSSPELAAALREGLAACGLAVLDVGVGPTPMLYFAVHHKGADAGIQVTGSHNPPDYNGFKMMLGHGSYFGERIQDLGRIAAAGDFENGEGRVEKVDLFDAYVARLLEGYTAGDGGGRPVNAVWDAGNGAAGPAMEALVAKLPGRHECLFADIDGAFPNHHPDPTVPKYLKDLIARVTEGGFDLGIAFDGDGDRIGVVDGRGRVIYGDQLLQILAADILKAYPGGTIIADVKSSQILFDEVARLGGTPLMWKTGHSLIKTKMVETDAPLSGEMSGHIFYKDKFYGHDDALYVAVRLIDLLARGDRTLTQIKDAIPTTHNTPEIRFDCAEDRKFAAIETVERRLAEEGAEVDNIDGVRVRTDDGWWLLRASNTQAVLVARAEAESEAGLEKAKAAIVRHLAAAGIATPEEL